jgi:hypothetical protein
MLAEIELDPYSFACDGPLFGVPHGWNVLTNLPFLVIGIWGLVRMRRAGGFVPADLNRAGLWVSVALTAFGSGAYHLWLTPATLAADRVCISAILAFVVAEMLGVVWPSLRRGRITLALLAVTELSVASWCLGATPLIYGALQAVGGIAMAWIAIRAWRGGRLAGTALRSLFLFIAFYALAKVAEALDEPVCAWTGVLGGHPLKHLLAAAGLAALLPWLGRSTQESPAATPRPSVA